MSQIEYPYLPEGREFKFVPEDNPMMQQARQAREKCAGDTIFPIGAVLVRDGKVLAYAGNGYNKGSMVPHVCPRVVQECPSGEGYELCNMHDSPGHAEQMVINVAREQGIDTKGVDMYFYGHWWACKPCWDYIIDARIRDVYLVEGAYDKFQRDKVFATTLKPSVKSAYISGALTNLPEDKKDSQKKLYEDLGKVCNELGIDAYIPHLHSDPETNIDVPSSEVFKIDAQKVCEAGVTIAEVSYPSLGTGGELMTAHVHDKPLVLLSKKDTSVSRFAKGNPAVVYHIEYEDSEDACRQLKNVLKQL
ncbi:MAG: deaminase [Candidatus Uhrbacteria bacterium]|nr:deaminase [Candidatus Uhrbacteria bacterium]